MRDGEQRGSDVGRGVKKDAWLCVSR